MKLETRVVRAALRDPFVSAAGAVNERELLLARLEDADGHAGFGEAAPLPSYDGVRISDVQQALEDCREVLGRGEQLDRAELLAECARLAVLPQALAAIDLALWDLAGRRSGEPVWQLLGERAVAAVAVNRTIAATDRAGAAREAAAAIDAGFGCVKVKVGVGDDAGRLAAVRAAGGPELEIRIDANGAWSPPEAVATLRALEPTGIELCEEPVHGLEEIAELAARTTVPLAIDETAAQPGALERRACDAVCLKISRCGGITGMLDAARTARAAGYDVYLASTLDGPLGIAAAAHAAVRLRPDRPCGLATLALFADRPDPLPPGRGLLAPPDGPGLGEGLVEWYT